MDVDRRGMIEVKRDQRGREREKESEKSEVLSAWNRDGPRRPRRCIQTTISLGALKTPVNSGIRGGEEGVQRPVDSQTGGRGPDQCISPLGATERGNGGEREVTGSEKEKEREREIVCACVIQRRKKANDRGQGRGAVAAGLKKAVERRSISLLLSPSTFIARR